MILKTGEFNVSILTEDAPFKIFQHFGFQSGRDTDKFDGTFPAARSANGLAYLTEYANAFISAKVIDALDYGTHTPVSYTHLDVYKRQLHALHKASLLFFSAPLSSALWDLLSRSPASPHDFSDSIPAPFRLPDPAVCEKNGTYMFPQQRSIPDPGSASRSTAGAFSSLFSFYFCVCLLYTSRCV